MWLYKQRDLNMKFTISDFHSFKSYKHKHKNGNSHLKERTRGKKNEMLFYKLQVK